MELSFDETIDFAKSQKLLMKFRDSGTIKSVRAFVFEVDPEIDNRQAELLHNYFDVCEFLQAVFSYLDRQAESMRINRVHPDVIAESVLASLEAHIVATQKVFTESSPPGGHPREFSKILPRASAINRELRDLQDTTILLLNAPLAKYGTHLDSQIENEEFVQLIRLGELYDIVRVSCDQFSYGRFSAKTRRASIVFRLLGDDAHDEKCWLQASYRMANDDSVWRLPLTLVEADLIRTIRGRAVQHDFWSFYDAPADPDWIRRYNVIRDGVRRHIETEVSKYFDLSAELKTQNGKFKFHDLIQGWSIFYGIANLARIRNLAAADDDDTWQFLVLAEQDRLVTLLRKELEWDKEKAQRLVSEFTSQVGSAKHIDLFYRPLLKLVRGGYVIAPTFVTAGRFDRNIFTIAVTESDLNQTKKGSVPVRRVVEEFRSANFKAVSDFKADVGGRVVTDIDIAAFKDQHLFLGQSKVVIEPDSVYDRWKVHGKLVQAAGQLDKVLQDLPSFIDVLLGRLGVCGRPQIIIPFIVTNSWQFTGVTVCSYPIVDFSYLGFLLEGATAAAITAQTHTVFVDEGPSFIKGRFATGPELARLIRNPIHTQTLPEGRSLLKLVRVGPYKIHVPYFQMKG